MTFDLESRQDPCLFSQPNCKGLLGGTRGTSEQILSYAPQALVSFKKYMPPSSSLLQGKHLPFSPSPLDLNIFRLFVILSLTQLYCYTPEIFLFSTATFKYTYRAPLRRIEQEYSANVAWSIFQSLKRIQPLPVRSKLI